MLGWNQWWLRFRGGGFLTVLHADIHALACLRRVSMHSIASKKDSLVLWEVRPNSLSNLICRPPIAILVGQIVWGHCSLRWFEDHLRVDIWAIKLLMVRCHFRLGMIKLTLLPPFSVAVIWIYKRTSLFSLGITMTEPDFAECIAHLIRISATKCQSAAFKMDMQAHTKVRNWDNIKNTPYVIRLLAFKAIT